MAATIVIVVIIAVLGLIIIGVYNRLVTLNVSART
jgi:hypothetical protein